MNKLKKAYLYAFYECYRQMYYLYKDNELKKIYATITLGIVLEFTIGLPVTILYLKIIGSKLLYFFVVFGSLLYFVLTFIFVGKKDKIYFDIIQFYKNKNELNVYKKIIFIYFLMCLILWFISLYYKYGEL